MPVTVDQKLKARVIKAMGHPSRLAILEALGHGERCVCELKDLVDADFSTVSKHLALMKRAGLLDMRKDGLKVFYSLRVPCILDFLNCIEAVMAGDTRGTRCCR